MQIVQQVAPLRTQVVTALRRDITDLVFRPGQPLVEPDLCQRYGVSRTVIREVLRQMESENLITMRPNRSPVVTLLSERDIESIYEVRADLEGLAGELFAVRASDTLAARFAEHGQVLAARMATSPVAERWELKDTFYSLLLEGANNPVLVSMLDGIHVRIGVFRHFAFGDDERSAQTVPELTRIVTACADDRDPVQAREACQDHVRHAGKLAIEEYRLRVPEMPV